MAIDIIVILDDDPVMRYPGGKGKTYPKLINLMPVHDVYIETHLGGGAVLRHKKPAARSIGIDVDPKVIQTWGREQPVRCELVQGRAEDFLAKYEFTGQELVYADPPYLPSTRKRDRVYTCDYTEHDHVRLLERLTELPCNVMVSGYDSPLYNEMLASWNKHGFNAMSHSGLRREVVWYNFDTPICLHDTRYIGEGFRQRQSVKRRIQRMQNKFDDMDPVERQVLIGWLNSTYSLQEVM